jgi:crossover junction endodeoxyribonuclease RusA
MPVEERNGIVSTPAPRLQGTPVVQFVTLPYPPTANNFKVPIVRGTRACMTLSAEARTWKGVAELRVSTANLVSLNGPVKLDIHVYRPRKVGDLDNAIKLSVDALSKYAYYDDEQVTEIHAYRHDDKANPRVEISIERAEE